MTENESNVVTEQPAAEPEAIRPLIDDSASFRPWMTEVGSPALKY